MALQINGSITPFVTQSRRKWLLTVRTEVWLLICMSRTLCLSFSVLHLNVLWPIEKLEIRREGKKTQDDDGQGWTAQVIELALSGQTIFCYGPFLSAIARSCLANKDEPGMMVVSSRTALVYSARHTRSGDLVEGDRAGLVANETWRRREGRRTQVIFEKSKKTPAEIMAEMMEPARKRELESLMASTTMTATNQYHKCSIVIESSSQLRFAREVFGFAERNRVFQEITSITDAIAPLDVYKMTSLRGPLALGDGNAEFMVQKTKTKPGGKTPSSLPSFPVLVARMRAIYPIFP
ncbi:hypothetical protein EV421DRAFT_1738140 [Armillaria borealis]|uniref:Uncharacterized protein n=1 Tax=Armillaria borealis TaxID=47425 RepID=A0AA39MMK0_9AGAR|nr:hypothetical protein EV421DRAFT_1738140 [Armillaria borealis]